jgi:hypothetical protein
MIDLLLIQLDMCEPQGNNGTNNDRQLQVPCSWGEDKYPAARFRFLMVLPSLFYPADSSTSVMILQWVRRGTHFNLNAVQLLEYLFFFPRVRTKDRLSRPHDPAKSCQFLSLNHVLHGLIHSLSTRIYEHPYRNFQLPTENFLKRQLARNFRRLLFHESNP